MTSVWRQLVQWGYVVRLPLALAAVSNTWVMLFLARRIEIVPHRTEFITRTPLPLLMFLSAVIALGLHLYGVTLNDVLHARYDRVFRPGRPIPSGRLRAASAAVVSVVSLLIALLASVFFGTNSVILCLAAAAGILLFDAVGRFFPALGILTLGGVRVLHMFVVNPPLAFGWPAWLAFSHLIFAVAVVHRLEGRRPRLTGAEVWNLLAGWTFASLALVGWITWRQNASSVTPPGIWVGPLILSLLFIALTCWIMIRWGDDPRQGRRAATWYLPLAFAWLIAYDLGWLLGADRIPCAAVHMVLLLAAGLALPAGAWIQGTIRYRPVFGRRRPLHRDL